MTFKQLKEVFSINDCDTIYYKKLAKNNNSKQQIYFGKSFDILNEIPFGSVVKSDRGEAWHANLDYSWIGEDGKLYKAPISKPIPTAEYSAMLRLTTFTLAPQ